MNPRQRLILKVALGVFILTALFPPWDRVYNGKFAGFAGFCFLFWPASWMRGDKIDVSILLVEWVALAVIAGVLMFLAKSQSPDATK